MKKLEYIRVNYLLMNNNNQFQIKYLYGLLKKSGKSSLNILIRLKGVYVKMTLKKKAPYIIKIKEFNF